MAVIKLSDRRPMRAFIWMRGTLISSLPAFGVISWLQTSLVSRRVTEGLLVFYDFADEEGKLVKDRSGVGESLVPRSFEFEIGRRSSGGFKLVELD